MSCRLYQADIGAGAEASLIPEVAGGGESDSDVEEAEVADEASRMTMVAEEAARRRGHDDTSLRTTRTSEPKNNDVSEHATVLMVLGRERGMQVGVTYACGRA